jgi:hypothetical protein
VVDWLREAEVLPPRHSVEVPRITPITANYDWRHYHAHNTVEAEQQRRDKACQKSDSAIALRA